MQSLSVGLVDFSSRENIGEIFINNRWFETIGKIGDIMKFFLIALLMMTTLIAVAQEDTNTYAKGKVDVVTNKDWARIEFQGEPAKAMYELLLTKNGRPYEFRDSFLIKGGGWECTKFVFAANWLNDYKKEEIYKCFGDFKGNGFQERNCTDAICINY